MKNISTSKIFVFGFALLLAGNVFAQTGFDGNSLPSFLGKAAESSELKDLISNYHCSKANDNHYLSATGIELILKGGSLSEINLFSKSAVYGSFAGKLPNDLKFGMASGTVKQLLGKPTESYNSGYCEFALPSGVISCWFEGGKLSQVGLAVK